MLYGRRAECMVIDRLLADTASSRSGALVLRGDAGVGKSALLAHVQERAAPTMRVLRGLGIQSESVPWLTASASDSTASGPRLKPGSLHV